MNFEMVFAAALLTDDILAAIHDLHAYSNGGGTAISREKLREIVDKYVTFDEKDFPELRSDVDWSAVVAYWREAVEDMEEAIKGEVPVYK
ncbi:hypothetical protein Nwi_1390 [Nitrobacter winogradskyi Nb-255]|uniref:Uncharacterized protein n=1 Tax=Nitrobacter winogradskyi (strain ATCC 25391 / DSM 10237 / CIP 104748 / NCIMB 11846 / Nb-255) TaxID=323098 RepID=Q3SSU0_NITWN|nr:hypothetical protein [Nitrobacter winogradskyi]ABA04651.1 hypothetical protein Nwi_1390 [Nitrobacter winogradskyi Nb-255]